MRPSRFVAQDDLLISLTRLRLMSVRFLAGFLWFSLRSAWQARRTPGFRGMRLLVDRKLTFWTATAWSDLDSLRAYRIAGSHRSAMARLPEWCDEASVTRWRGPVASMQDWERAHARMVAAGKPSHVIAPSADQQARCWPLPRLRPRLELVMAASSRADMRV